MIDRSEAEEHLRVIRSLMEKATIYRTISAEAAAVGGALALGGSFAFGNWWLWRPAESFPTKPMNPWAVIGVWIAVLALSAVANLYFLHRAAKQRGEPFVSNGMRLALVSLLPSFAAAGWFTMHTLAKPFIALCAPIWMTFYGLGLLATGQFSPRSLVSLGWAFLIAGLLSFDLALFVSAETLYPIPTNVDPAIWKEWRSAYIAQGLMAASFGLFHLVYAACTWPRRAR